MVRFYTLFLLDFLCFPGLLGQILSGQSQKSWRNGNSPCRRLRIQARNLSNCKQQQQKPHQLNLLTQMFLGGSLYCSSSPESHLGIEKLSHKEESDTKVGKKCWMWLNISLNQAFCNSHFKEMLPFKLVCQKKKESYDCSSSDNVFANNRSIFMKIKRFFLQM